MVQREKVRKEGQSGAARPNRQPTATHFDGDRRDGRYVTVPSPYVFYAFQKNPKANSCRLIRYRI
ncbi:hypothetical protein HYALB_00002893 [Hymenoscyphus albidus]|uniref:Uncharacterized protein n=1 Tax=Hymenoscyphus albidus TaxID=595503 RepID=A0A9N9QCU4_9HELO|nr:hypothetical protein HYALB_00002893 [Hymenoscyphus albidus]